MTILLLITDSQAVREMIPGLDGDVMRCPTVGAARRFLVSKPQARVGMVAWGSDVVRSANGHWRLDGPQLAGVPQVAVRVPAWTPVLWPGMEALGLERCVVLPDGLEAMNREVWGASDADAA